MPPHAGAGGARHWHNGKSVRIDGRKFDESFGMWCFGCLNIESQNHALSIDSAYETTILKCICIIMYHWSMIWGSYIILSNHIYRPPSQDPDVRWLWLRWLWSQQFRHPCVACVGRFTSSNFRLGVLGLLGLQLKLFTCHLAPLKAVGCWRNQGTTSTSSIHGLGAFTLGGFGDTLRL